MAEVPASTGSLSGDELPLQLTPPNDWTGSPLCNGSLQNKAVRFGSLEPALFTLAKRSALPLVIVLVLANCMLIDGQSLSMQFWALALLVFLISAQVLSPLDLRHRERSAGRTRKAAFRILLEWTCVAAMLLFLKIAFKLTHVFPRDVMVGWFLATPFALLLVDSLSIPMVKRFTTERSIAERYIIIGANEVGLELARRISQSQGGGQFWGFFDYRSAGRLPQALAQPATANCTACDFADFVRRNSINRVYLALPISTAPRIQELLKELRDTTASIYFVPNIFAFDLVQARCVEINGMPAFSICDSPLQGMSGLWKRAFDLLLATLLLLLFWPALLAVAAAIKLSSPGPVLFKQRRYGLHGEEILVYKFRSMTVCEDGPVVAQAMRRDHRVTALGAFLRRNSLDELPQILNVLEGKMSFVGPRPHAVAHNEEYRKLISGYMIRHKVRPGITGWAQVNGLRGETSTVEKMQRRVQYDLDYLKNWSLAFDLKIIWKTALTVFFHRNAY
jgi:putative colanic acid biosysnthesis UDP-glucose lipid carrier transferase